MTSRCLARESITGGAKQGHWSLSVKNRASILQGSVASLLRCGGICGDDFNTNLLLNPTVKEFCVSKTHIPPYGSMVAILSSLSVCLYGYGFLSGGKSYRRETSHACSTTIRDELLAFW